MDRYSARLSLLFFHSLALGTLTILFFGPLGGLFLPRALAQGSKRASVYDSVRDKDKDRPDLRDRWMMRGRTAPTGQSAGALRLRAHQQKMAMREAARKRAEAGGTGFVATNSAQRALQAPSEIPWVPLGPAPLISDQNFYGAVTGRVTAVALDPTDGTGNTVYVAGASGGVWKSTNAAAA